MTLLAFAAEHWPCSNRSISPGHRATAASPLEWRAAGKHETDGQTGGRTLDGFIDSALYNT